MRRLTAVPAFTLAALSVACGNTAIHSSAPTPSGAASTPPVTPASTSAIAPAAGSPVDHLRGVGSAQQVIEVAASGYGTTYATLTAYRKTSSGWVRSYGPWTARIGVNGFAPPGKKREGDGRTPTGSYGFRPFFFGVYPRPSGIRYTWRHAYTYDVWDDDPTSARYNLWTDRRTQNPGRSPEPLHVTPQYEYAAVVGYNSDRKPYLGSAIFLHVSAGRSTAGCIAVPQTQLLKLLRWLNPRLAPRIIMGTASAITR